MTAVELLKHQVDACGDQLRRVLKGLDGTSADFRLHEGAMSLGEQITHLAEAYQATVTTAGGGKHEWGSFSLSSSALDAMVEETFKLREAAVRIVLNDDDERLKMGADYIVAHDNYHIGQLVTMRLRLVPSWNSYEIYG